MAVKLLTFSLKYKPFVLAIQKVDGQFLLVYILRMRITKHPNVDLPPSIKKNLDDFGLAMRGASARSRWKLANVFVYPSYFLKNLIFGHPMDNPFTLFQKNRREFYFYKHVEKKNNPVTRSPL